MMIMMMVINATDRYNVMIILTCCFGCHYNHNSRKCRFLHTEANDFFSGLHQFKNTGT